MAKFAKGVSGNPGGRPAGIGEIREIAREHTGAAIQVLVKVMNSSDAAPSARVGAATALLDRGWGRPPQTINASVEKDVGIDPELVDFASTLLAQMNTRPGVIAHLGRSENTRETEAMPDVEAEGETPSVDATAH